MNQPGIRTIPPFPRPYLRTGPGQDRSDRPVLSAAAAEFAGVTVTRMQDADGDIARVPFARNTLVVSLDGAAAYDLSFEEVRASAPIAPATVAALPGGVTVDASWRNRTPEQAVVMIEFDPTLFQRHAPEIATPEMLGGHLHPRPFREAATLCALARLLARELDAATRRGRLFAETLLRALALEIGAQHWTGRAAPAPAPRAADPRIRRALEFIEAHHAADISLAEIAAAAAMSASHLAATFRAATGMAPYAYVIDRRLRAAVEMLRNSDLPIAQVALAAGFCDQAHLTRACRARLGRTPRAIRAG